LLGDEMLIAPIYEPGGKRQVYLPQGVWTDLESNLVYQGRQTISVTTESLPVFARNGTILPLDAEGGMELHYFPKLGAEFFLLETDAQAWTQVHASPAVDVMRLQIESKKDRDYVWVVHHVDRPSAVGFDEVRFREASAAGLMADRTWFYDAARKNVHIRVRVAAGADSIINLEN
jgi:alpha-glucosidase (family GH31 glycosyl hydrolase)